MTEAAIACAYSSAAVGKGGLVDVGMGVSGYLVIVYPNSRQKVTFIYARNTPMHTHRLAHYWPTQQQGHNSTVTSETSRRANKRETVISAGFFVMGATKSF